MFAFVGAVGLFHFDCLNHFDAHHMYVGVLCIGAWYWKKDLLPYQTNISAMGFAVGVSGFALLRTYPHFIFGAMIGLGELMILSAWVSMIFNA